MKDTGKMKKIENKIKDWIKKNYPDGYIIYRGYYDNLSPDMILNYLEQENPMDAFYEHVSKLYEDYYYSEIISDIYNDIVNDMTDEEARFMEENEEECMTVVYENLESHFPYDDFLDEKICCDIVIDNGDANTDFNAHTISPCYEAVITKNRSNLSRESGMMLIAKLQDYRIKDFRKIFNACRYADTYGKPEKMKDLNQKYLFITSCYREIKESTGPLTAFVFCVKTTLREMLAWNTEKTDIRISKNIETCGLYDYWNGAGSNLEIHLEKDMVIPKEKVYRFVPDFYWDYSIEECYGMTSKAWTTMPKVRETT